MGVAGQRLTTWSRAPQREASSLKELAMMTRARSTYTHSDEKSSGQGWPTPPSANNPLVLEHNIQMKLKLKLNLHAGLYMSPESIPLIVVGADSCRETI